MLTRFLQPNFETFQSYAQQGNLVPVWIELAADYETPLSAFQQIYNGRYGFLLESAEFSEHSGRFSILGSDPRLIFTARGKQIEIEKNGVKESYEVASDPMLELEAIMNQFKPVGPPPSAAFHGGVVGYLSYDMVKFFEPTLSPPPPDRLGIPDMVYMLADTVVIFDHKHRKLSVVANVFLPDHVDAQAAYAWAEEKIAAIVTKLESPVQARTLQAIAPASAQDKAPALRSNTTQAEYEQMVNDGKEFIKAGDIFQFVPSQRFECDFEGSPLDLYRALRHVNPSPYMFCLCFPDGFSLVGSSPEVHVKCINRKIEIRPIAGTRWRGKTVEEDDALADELLKDPKERAEHIMLVDLARNDVGRVSKYGSVKVSELMIIERYSHVMHIVSNVSGELDPSRNSFDVMRATFPAGTVSGSPKVRAMEIINSLEKNKRCAYAGAVGYFGFDGSLNSCIALRTCVVKDGKVFVQAGAGVVADSDPTYEYNETVNKARGMLRAIEAAKQLAR